MTLYCVYFTWPNTASNHAGMAYFAQSIKCHIKIPVKLIKVPDKLVNRHIHLKRVWQLALIFALKFSLKKNDQLFFMEYFGGWPAGNQDGIVIKLRKLGVLNRMIGLVHLPSMTLKKRYSHNYIMSGLAALDDVIVFGSSLEDYFTSLGFGIKVHRTFHYVDTEYYQPRQRAANAQFTTIALGNYMRDPQNLCEIIAACPDIRFNICMGAADWRNHFTGLPNAVIFPYLQEVQLLSLMQEADASISVFTDTIGSNVICTCLACGLPQVVSDVGSIKDYCTEENSVFCKSNEEFIQALHHLSKSQQICADMSHAARLRGEGFSLQRSLAWFEALFLNRQ